MRLKKFVAPVLLLMTMFYSLNAFSLDLKYSTVTNNLPVKEESQKEVIFDPNERDIDILEGSYKSSLEKGDINEAEKLKEKMYRLIPSERISTPLKFDPEIVSFEKHEENVSDWTTSNPVVHYGKVMSVPVYYRQIDLKAGEDGNLYSAVLRPGGSVSFITIYKSTNQGNSWLHVVGIGYTGSMTNVSITVESKNNLEPDSTRIIAFYTLSDYYYKNSIVNYISVRSNGTNYSTGTIATPDPGNKFTSISAVSDGAFYQNATYFGFICAESDNDTEETKKIKFYRSIDWGATWVSSTLTTNYDDRFLSAAFRKASPDSLYIAVERRFDSTLSLIRVLATRWVPSSNFYTYYVTPGSNTKYEKPCINIQQTNPAGVVMITCTKDNIAKYHFSSNGGASWNKDLTLGQGNNSNIKYTYCSSSASGENSFTSCIINADGDSVNMQKGVPGNMGPVKYKVNSLDSKDGVSPVCEVISKNGKNFSMVIYAGTDSPNGNVYSTMEGTKRINIYTMPQGFYDPATNGLAFGDTLTVYLRNAGSPFNIIDSAISVMSVNTLACYPEFRNVSDGEYFVSVKHRNSIETWCSSPLNFNIPGDKTIDLINTHNQAYGNNLVQVDNVPVRYAMFSGDVNNDGSADLSDVVQINNDANVFTNGYNLTDLTGDFSTDLSDVVLALNNASAFVSVKRP